MFNKFPEMSKSLIQILYDADCTLICWIIVTDGSQISQEWIQQQNCDALFLITPNGRLTSTTLRNALILITR